MKLLEQFGLDEKTINKFAQYADLLIEWNKKFNLTAITDIFDIEEKHFVDSIMLTKYVDIANKTLLDVGTGAGFPGIPLAIVEPTLKVTLLESNGKKVSFLKEVKEKLNLENITIIQGRSEEQDLREKFDIVTGRAVKELNVLLELSFYMVKVGGKFIAYKSVNIDKEIENALRAFKALKIEDYKLTEYKLPSSNDSRVLFEATKTVKTLKKYPRRYSEIVKSPL